MREACAWGEVPVVSSPQYDHTLANARLMMEAFAERRLPDWEVFAATTDLMIVDRAAVLAPAFTLHPYVYLVTRGLLKLRLTQARVARTVSFHAEGEVAASFNGLGISSFGRVSLRTSPRLAADPRAGQCSSAGRARVAGRTPRVQVGRGRSLVGRRSSPTRLTMRLIPTSVTPRCAASSRWLIRAASSGRRATNER